ncbi:PadR family transcriptional regulator [Blastomonas sp.]|uniref:PadR family transcriptional regulator n=1 Tax=Blastomonas TaxID=150203 RepID=UPI002586E080|nr:PadR family transcriptional regulator [Blastomonas sp.]
MGILTNLEGAALAEIASRGSATSYAIAQVFARSPSEYWSGSAGAVYPLIKRLAARGLLEPSAAAAGKRQRLDYQITPAGRVALEEWLLDAQSAAGMGFDPLRTRLGHLHLVSPEQRREFLDQVRTLSAEFAQRPAFEGEPVMVQIHQSWLKARAMWLTMLDFVVR